MVLLTRWGGCRLALTIAKESALLTIVTLVIVNILLVNWQDRANPQAGGAEIHLFEIFGRLAAAGHRVRLICSGWTGGPRTARIDGIDIERVGGRNSFALLGRGAVQRAIVAERPDILVEDINKLPLFLTTGTRLPFCAIVPHLFGATAFAEAPWPVAAIVWASERPLPWAYRRAGFHAISESTRDDLVARGIPSERIRVIHPGVDSSRFTPGPPGRRSATPTFLYVGRLKRYKGIGFAIRALALARRHRPDLRLEIAGTGDQRAELEQLAASLGLRPVSRFPRIRERGAQNRPDAQCVGQHFPLPEGRMGDHGHRSGGVRNAVACVG